MRQSTVSARALLLASTLLVAGTSVASAASYEKTDGSIVDPIQSFLGGDHAYFGNNLAPNADLGGARLRFASLAQANLSFAFLNSADLTSADLPGANLSGANLANANLTFAFLPGADLTDAILFRAEFLSTTTGDAFYNANTDFTGTSFDPVAAGWLLVPEPAAATLQLAALLGVAWLRRRWANVLLLSEPPQSLP